MASDCRLIRSESTLPVPDRVPSTLGPDMPSLYGLKVIIRGKGEPRWSAELRGSITCDRCFHAGDHGKHKIDFQPAPTIPMMHGQDEAKGTEGVAYSFLLFPAWSNNAGNNHIEVELRDGDTVLGKAESDIYAEGFE